MHTNYNFYIKAHVSTLYNYQCYKIYCLPWVVEAVRAREAVVGSAVFVDSLPVVVVVDNVVLEVEVPLRTVVSGAEKKLNAELVKWVEIWKLNNGLSIIAENLLPLIPFFEFNLLSSLLTCSLTMNHVL